MKPKAILDQFIRFFTGALFIFSGLVKLNDPVGTAIKLEEYFEVFATDFGSFFHVFIPYALELGMILVVLEVVLGVAVLINYQMQYTTKILLVLILYFTFLTFYSAYFDKVTDCGCFGDAVPLTPWESFSKDVILTIFILHLFWYRKNYVALLSNTYGHIVIVCTTMLSAILGVYAIQHLPYIDFRPYKVGDSIPYNMQPAEQPVGEYTFIKDGKKIKSKAFLPDSEGYVYESYKIINPKASTPKITDFNLWNPDLGDYTEQSFIGKKLFFITVDAAKADIEHIKSVQQIISGLGDAVDIMIITSSDPSVVEAFRHEYQLAVPYFFSDATVIKAMIRSNPGIMALENGTVKGKWHYNDTPTAAQIESVFSQ